MLFELVCISLLAGILIAVILILTILLRVLIREFKIHLLSQVQDQVQSGINPILEKLDEMKLQGSVEILEKLDAIKHEGLMPLGHKVGEIAHDVSELYWFLCPLVGQGGPPTSKMMEDHVAGGHRAMAPAPGYSSKPRDPGHSIHVFRNGCWELQEDFSKAGYEVCRPSMKGSYEGQVVKIISGPAPEANY